MSAGPVCNNCSNDATIEFLPGVDDEGNPEQWCFDCFLVNYVAVDADIVVRPRKSRDTDGPLGQLAGEAILDHRNGVPE